MSLFFISYNVIGTEPNMQQVNIKIENDMGIELGSVTIFSADLMGTLTSVGISLGDTLNIILTTTGIPSTLTTTFQPPFIPNNNDCIVFKKGNFIEPPTLRYINDDSTFQILNQNEGRNANTVTLNWGIINCFTQIICVFPGTLVQTSNDLKKIEEIRKDDLVIDENGEEVRIINNVKCHSGFKGYTLFEKNSLGQNLPTHPLRITDGHPIHPPNSNQEAKVEELVNNKDIIHYEGLIPGTYTLITENRTFVLMNGISVCTWSKLRFKEFVQIETLSYQLL